MAVYIFQSQRDARYFGFTTNADGANLPPDFGPWRPFAGLTVPVRSERLSRVGLRRRQQTEIERFGYCIMQAVPVAKDHSETKH